MTRGQFVISWVDGGREPKVAPNSQFPDGINIDAAGDAETVCLVALPYPAKRIGTYIVKCELCGLRVALSTAGRPDDPRSIKVACLTLPVLQ